MLDRYLCRQNLIPRKCTVAPVLVLASPRLRDPKDESNADRFQSYMQQNLREQMPSEDFASEMLDENRLQEESNIEALIITNTILEMGPNTIFQLLRLLHQSRCIRSPTPQQLSPLVLP